MESFLRFFEVMPTWERAVWIIGCMSLFWILEGYYPLFNHSYRKWRHAGVNVFFLFTTMLINVGFGILTVGVFEWIHNKHFGLIYLVNWPMWLEFLVSILIFELFGQYLSHYLLHRVKWMWKLHMIHHSDTHVDVTTGTRHHPGDFLIREVFALIAVVITGAPVGLYFFYRILNVFFTYFSHANINLPVWLDKALSWVFVTPGMHKFHHHFERPWTDTNFGNIFSIWDRLFGTFAYDDPKKIRYGLDVLEKKPDENIGYQLRLPFDKSIKTDY
jgi:sterol desaturase/sphingolipid hydroxylase (fatty acid hydroxylase superfamily)